MQERKLEILKNFINLLNSGSEFSEFTLYNASREANISTGELLLLFPYKMQSVFEEIFNNYILKLQSSINNIEKTTTTNNIEQSVISSFKILLPYKKALRKVVKFLLLPSNVLFSKKYFWKISSAIWDSNGITDSTFSYHTKRLTLSVIYANCFGVFLLSRKESSEAVQQILQKQFKLLFSTIKLFKK